MKQRICLGGMVAVILWAWVWAAEASTFYWRHAGRDPFLGRIWSLDDLNAKFQGNQGLFAERLRIADRTLPSEGIAAGTAAALESRRGVRPETLRDGTHVAWMIDGHGVRRNVVVVGDRPGYRVSILGTREGQIYDFHWASSCGNVTPLGTRPLPRHAAARVGPTFWHYREVVVLRPMPVLTAVPLPCWGPGWAWW